MPSTGHCCSPRGFVVLLSATSLGCRYRWIWFWFCYCLATSRVCRYRRLSFGLSHGVADTGDRVKVIHAIITTADAQYWALLFSTGICGFAIGYVTGLQIQVIEVSIIVHSKLEIILFNVFEISQNMFDLSMKNVMKSWHPLCILGFSIVSPSLAEFLERYYPHNQL